jgi:glycosyltransferase involved in cell wall biosynthesis
MALERSRILLVTAVLKRNGVRIGRTVFTNQLIDYILPRCHRLYLIEQPFENSDDLTPTMQVFESGVLVSKRRFPYPRFLATRTGPAGKVSLLLRFRDLLSSFYFMRKIGFPVNLAVCVESENAAVGITLRRLGLVRSVAYLVVDYMPRRFESPFLNSVFHALDRHCLLNSDYSWSLSDRVQKARKVRWGRLEGSTQVAIPMASPVPLPGAVRQQKRRRDVVYIGALLPKFGVEELAKGFARALGEVGDARLHVIGDGESLKWLEGFVAGNHLEKSIIIHGMLNNEDADFVIASSSVGIAPYRIVDTNSQFIYSEVGKVKLYVTYGLPVIVSKYAASGELIARHNAGLLIDCAEEDISNAVMRLLKDDQLYEEQKRNAIKLAEESKPERIFEQPILQALREKN